jgi:hypothetical protein
MPPLPPFPLAPRDASAPLARRQNSVPLIPITYVGENSDPPPGTVVGIVVGSVLGFLMLTMLIFWARYRQSDTFHSGRGPAIASIEVRDRRSRSRSPRRLSRRGADVTEIRRVSRGSLSPRRRSFSPRTSRRTEIVEERFVEERFPGRESVRRVVSPARNGEIIVEKRRRKSRSRSRARGESEMEEVIVYDDESTELSTVPPEPRRSSGRRSSGYRPADRDRYAERDYARRPASSGFS